MKVLGLSFGHSGGTCGIAVKQALKGIMDANHEDVAFLNVCNLKIDRCTGCGACDRRRDNGGMSMCVLPDDFPFVEKQIVDADALIVASPVYVLGPPGQYKNLVDRLGPSHDQSFLLKENERRRALGWSEDKMIPEKYFKNRPLALISIGGARTEGWTSMGLSNMYLLGFPMHMVPVDALNIYDMGDKVSPILDDTMRERLMQMGKNVLQEMGKPQMHMQWHGDKEGVCPICHCDQLTVRDGTTVECSVCGSIGTLEVLDGKIHVIYPQKQLERSRYRPGGDMEHCLEIKSFVEVVPKVIEKYGARIQELEADLECVPVIKKNTCKK